MADDVIYSYTADDAMRDGILFDVSELAKEAGLSIPVRITIGVKQLITPSEKVQELGQSFKGRLWDILCLAVVEIHKTPDGRFVSFAVDIRDSPSDFQTH